MSAKSTDSKKYRILLLTNCHSDNVGDQVIEATDIALIKAAMSNLGVAEDGFEIKSTDAGIISKKYVETKDTSLLANAYRLIEWCDVVFFGGAPQFNYLYQIFYERTATIIDIADSLGKTVVFSSIGIESYDESDARCIRLKKAVNSDNVKRITTRDGFHLLEQYKSRPDLYIEKVADPAVFTNWVFSDYLNASHNGKASNKDLKKVGLFIIRAGAFTSNGIPFSWRKAAKMWLEIIRELEQRGIDYELITSGHYGDEAFLDRLIRDYNVPSSKCVFGVSNPETLVSRISSYEAVLSCRLHPSIISYSLRVPAISLVWNPKVQGFYEGIGYSERALDVTASSPAEIVKSLVTAFEAGVSHDREYMMSVYTNIFYALRDSLGIISAEDVEVFSFDELTSVIPHYPGTSAEEQRRKDIRKLRRTYEKFNDRTDELGALRKENKKLKARKPAKSPVRKALSKFKKLVFH